MISVGGAIVVGTGLLYTARNYRLSRRGQVTDRFTVALERLGSTELYVRIGGVHALEHVMRDSPYHHDDVIEVLTQFIRGRVPFARQPDRQRWMHPVTGSVPDRPPEPTPDVQAALTALAHRPLRPERQDINLGHLHLRGARLNDANLTGAFLTGADLTGAFLTGADLTGANLGGTDLTGADLTGADLRDAFLIGADLTGADLRDADLTGADLTGQGLTYARLTGADLGGAHLTGQCLTYARLTGANLGGTDLTGADLRDAFLIGADLTRAHLIGANLTGANLRDADLTGADLGPDPGWVPSGWIVTDPKTGELGRRGVLSAAWLTGAAGPVSPQRGIVPYTKLPTVRFHLNAAISLAA